MATVYDVIVNYKLNTTTATKGARGLAAAENRVAKQRAQNEKWLTGVRSRSMLAEQQQWAKNERFKISTQRRSLAMQTKMAKQSAGIAAKASGGGGKGAGFMLADAFRWVGLAYLTAGAVSTMKSAFIDFNTTLESTRISMATGLFGFGKVDTFTDGLKRGKAIVEDYRKTAAAGVGELKDYTTMHGQLQGSVFAAGGNVNQVTDMTKGGVVAASALGVEGWKAAQDMAQMVRGNVTERDYTAKQIIEMRFKDMGIETGGDALGKFREMYKTDAKARLKFIQEALTSKTLQEARAAYETSMQGRIDQFTDNVKLALAQVGEGLFEGVKGTLADINQWISDNPTKIRDIAKQVGETAVQLFNAVKTMVSFIHEWSGVIIAAAKVWLAYALAAKTAAAYQAIRSGGGGLMAAARGGVGAAGSGGFVAGTVALAAGWQIGKALSERMEKNGNTGRENMTAFYIAMGDSNKESKKYLRAKRDERVAIDALNRAIDATANKLGLLGSPTAKNNIENTELFTNDEEVKAFESKAAQVRARLEKENAARVHMGYKPIDVEGQVKQELARMIALDPSIAKDIEKRERSQQVTGRIDDFSKRGVDFMGRQTKSKEDMVIDAVTAKFGGAIAPETITQQLGIAMTQVDKTALSFAALANKSLGLLSGKDDQTVKTTLSAEAVAAWVIDQLAKTVEGQKAAADAEKSNAATKKGGNMNVTINRIQVESNDPDRFVYGMREAFVDAVRNPSQAKPAIRGMGKRGG